MSKDEQPSPRDAELIDFLTRMLPEIGNLHAEWSGRYWAWAEADDDTPDPGEFAVDAGALVAAYRYHVRNLAEAIPLVGGPFAGTIVRVQRAGDWRTGDPSPYYEIRQAGQRHHYTLTRLHCGHYEYRYREDAPPEEAR